MSNRFQALIVCAALVLIAIPLVLKWVPPNPIYGFRTSKSRVNRKVWFAANAFAGWALIASSLLSAILLWLTPATVSWPLLFGAPLAAAIVATLIYVDNLDATSAALTRRGNRRSLRSRG
jgi:uncharacterized membrane protein